MDYTLNLRGRLLSLSRPLIMGIVNVTDDSFFAGSRTPSAEAIAARAAEMAALGADIIDIGACSTRPGSEPVSEEQETARLRMAIPVVRQAAPGIPLSIDTFRPDVARICVEELGAHIINDVSEGRGTLAPDAPDTVPSPMFRTVARLGVPYILTSLRPDVPTTLLALSDKVQQLRDLGQKDIIIDPGFGFGKTLEENYRLLNRLEELHVLGLPLLVGISRKSMAYKLLGVGPSDVMAATTALNTVALIKGAAILRVHDVSEAVQARAIVNALAADTQQPDTNV